MLKTHEIFDFQTKNYMVKFSVPQKCKILAAWSLNKVEPELTDLRGKITKGSTFESD